MALFQSCRQLDHEAPERTIPTKDLRLLVYLKNGICGIMKAPRVSVGTRRKIFKLSKSRRTGDDRNTNGSYHLEDTYVNTSTDFRKRANRAQKSHYTYVSPEEGTRRTDQHADRL
jgi:hypothetical protein